MQLKRMFPGISRKRRGTNLLELLLALSILTAALYPVVYIFKLGTPAKAKTQKEFLATMLAHHVIETIVANKDYNHEYLPPMTESEPVVSISETSKRVSEYFLRVTKEQKPISESSNKELYWSLKPFSCQVDTYYLEGALYKIIAYINYEREGRKMRVFLERLLAQKPPETISEGEL